MFIIVFLVIPELSTAGINIGIRSVTFIRSQDGEVHS
jgi:hypothetical protein